MSRKKMKRVVKSMAKKTSTKRQVKSMGLSLAETMERDFRAAPAKLVAQYRKDLTAHKQQEKKLIVALKKAQAQKKAAMTKCNILAKKSTAAAKKQLTAAKKAFATVTSTVSNLTAQLEQVKKIIRANTQKQIKFATLGKQLAKLEKQLEVSTKKPAKPVAKTRKASSKKEHVAAPVMIEAMTQQEEQPTIVSVNESVELETESN